VKELVELVARSLAGKPEQVAVTESDEGGTLVLELTVAAEDLGQIIGREGRTARALRALASAGGHKQQRRVSVRIRD
jgi:predicted RNA-binding protein YlqC (UPF0109 family)